MEEEEWDHFIYSYQKAKGFLPLQKTMAFKLDGHGHSFYDLLLVLPASWAD